MWCAGLCVIWQVRTLLLTLLLIGCLGTLSQCPPLPVVVMAEAGLSGEVHHVVLFAGAAGRERRSERERKKGMEGREGGWRADDTWLPIGPMTSCCHAPSTPLTLSTLRYTHG